MASKRRKSVAIAVAFIGVAGLSLASASTLGITPGTLQAGSVALVDCQGGSVVATMSAGAFSASLAVPGYTAGNVSLTGINGTACDGKMISASLISSTNTVLASTSLSPIVAATTSALVTVPADVAAKDVARIAVVIADS